MGYKLSKDERERVAANETYFIVLAESRASLVNLPVIAFVNALFLGFITLMAGATATVPGSHQGFFGVLFCAHLVLLAFSALVLLLTFLRPLIFRVQVLFSGVMAVCAAVMVYALCFVGIAMVVHVDRAGNTVLDVALFPVVGVIGLLYICGATVVHVLLLRKRLREGHSEARTLGNLGAASSLYSSKSMWFIFAAVTVIPNILTQGQYLVQTLGVILFLFLAAVTPSLPVEFSYLAYLKSRDKRYWEVRPRKRRKKGRAHAVFKKIGMWVGIFGAVCVAMGIAGTVIDGLK
ncbi:hypothetical protein GCM10027406_07010 [Leifsonia lichenia]